MLLSVKRAISGVPESIRAVAGLLDFCDLRKRWDFFNPNMKKMTEACLDRHFGAVFPRLYRIAGFQFSGLVGAGIMLA